MVGKVLRFLKRLVVKRGYEIVTLHEKSTDSRADSLHWMLKRWTMRQTVTSNLPDLKVVTEVALQFLDQIRRFQQVDQNPNFAIVTIVVLLLGALPQYLHLMLTTKMIMKKLHFQLVPVLFTEPMAYHPVQTLNAHQIAHNYQLYYQTTRLCKYGHQHQVLLESVQTQRTCHHAHHHAQ
jgi:hypothetical protein